MGPTDRGNGVPHPDKIRHGAVVRTDRTRMGFAKCVHLSHAPIEIRCGETPFVKDLNTGKSHLSELRRVKVERLAVGFRRWHSQKLENMREAANRVGASAETEEIDTIPRL